jgi:hypothetical protein
MLRGVTVHTASSTALSRIPDEVVKPGRSDATDLLPGRYEPIQTRTVMSFAV